ncbi:MAG: DUF559 domain-containing protein [Micropruina sp.]|uniref:DUF559 domain-containing protein n=1 Tax=Micropruina sp. TaxID=2737536 RepID=UPI0039E2AF09
MGHPLMAGRVASQRAAAYCRDRGLRIGSNLENYASMRLHQAGHEWESQLPVFGYRLDFAFTYGETSIDLEIDGPFHWTPRTLAEDKLRDTALRDAGWMVIRVHDGDTFDAQLSNVSFLLHAIKRCS